MKFLPNANEIAQASLQRDNTISVYKNLIDTINHNYRHVFSSNFQMYVTKVGLALSDASADAKMSPNTYLGSLNYICLKTLNNKALYNVMRAIKMNDAGNTMKHNNEDLDKIDIDFILKQYNQMISLLVKATKLSAFKICYLNKGKNQRDVPLAEDPKHHKYFQIEDIKLQLKISSDYTVDQYTKELTSKITLYWPKGHDNRYADVTITNTKTKKELCHSYSIDLSKDNSKHALQFTCGESDLNRRVLTVSVKVEILKDCLKSYRSGIFRRLEVYHEKTVIAEKTETLSQFFRPEQKKQKK